MKIPDQFSDAIYTVFDNDRQTGLIFTRHGKGFFDKSTEAFTVYKTFMQLNPHLYLQSAGMSHFESREQYHIVIDKQKSKR